VTAAYLSRTGARTSTRATTVDKPEIEEVFREFAAPVHNYLRAAGMSDCEDLLSDIFIDIMRGLERFQGDRDALRRWIFTIAHHRRVDEQRRLVRKRKFLLERQPRHLAPAADEALDHELLAALDTLTADQREVVVLRFVSDLSLETVAHLTGRTPGAVKSLQHRALRNLAHVLASAQITTATTKPPSAALPTDD
jgi:RNA polymerase sigma-70 factor (ECF subfamily)